MARIVFMSTGEKGHTNPMLGVALHLREGGHEIAWLCIPEPAAQLVGLGIPMLELPGAPPPPPHITSGEALASLVRDPIALRTWIKTLLLDAVPAQIAPVRAALRAFAPDVIALDPMLYQGVIAAHEEDIPYVGISSSLNPIVPDDWDADLARTVRALAAQRTALFAAHGMAPTFKVCDCLSPYANTVFTTAAYAGDVTVPPHTFLVGPSRLVDQGASPLGGGTPPSLPHRRGDETDFPWHRLTPGAPVIYASFGSQISWQPMIFEKIAAAAAPLGVSLVLSAGELAGSAWAGALPGAPIVVGYAPQLALLAKAAVLITHGGANSIMEALSAGVPMLCSPVCNDQPFGGRFLAQSGAGVVLDLHTASVEDLRTALRALLTEGEPRTHAARIRASYDAHDGARAAAELVIRADRAWRPR